MNSDPGQVIVMTEDAACPSVHCYYLHHRGFPEVRAEGESLHEAASRLVERLHTLLDSAPSEWRRQGIERARADVRAFTERCT